MRESYPICFFVQNYEFGCTVACLAFDPEVRIMDLPFPVHRVTAHALCPGLGFMGAFCYIRVALDAGRKFMGRLSERLKSHLEGDLFVVYALLASLQAVALNTKGL